MPRVTEEQRLAALESYEVLDTLPEQAFDDLTELACQLTNAPIALVSLIDRNRQWFKSCVGLSTHETPRAVAFCDHAIRNPEPFVVEDAHGDARFRDNPLVTGEPHIRFYAGFPLIDEYGAALGTLCVIDTKPRRLTALQMSSMSILARQVVAQLHLRRITIVLREELVHSKFVAEAGRRLARSLDIKSTLQSVAKLAVPTIADACTVIVDQGGQYQRVAEAGIDPPTENEIRAFRARGRNEDSLLIARAAFEAKGPVLFRDYASWLAERLPEDNPYRAFITRLGVTSAIAAPMMIGDRALGVWVVAQVARSGRKFREHDVSTMGELAQRAALALDNARLFEQATEANRTKDLFLAAISHDLRTPLSAILGWTQMLRRKPDDKATVERAVDVIERSAGAQARFIEDLLDVTRITAGQLRVEREPIDLVEVIEQAIDDVRPSANAKNLTLALSLDPHAGRVLGDAGRMQQVVWNLMNNAIKFSEPGQSIEVSLRRRDGSAELTVRDYGRGIAKELVPNIFERFRQDSEGVGRRLGGLGLGLSIAKHIVEEMGGTIRAESEGSGRGACFVVRLPLNDEVARPAPQR